MQGKTLLWASSVGLILLMALPRFVSAAFVNGANDMFQRVVISSEALPGTYPLWRIASGSNLLDTAHAGFRFALRFDPRNFRARSGCLRTALASGVPLAADDAWCLETPFPLLNPLHFLDLLLTESRSGNNRQVLDLYAQYHTTPFRVTQTLTDTVVISYLDIARGELEQGCTVDAKSALFRVLELRPVDLYARFHLWNCAIRRGDQGEASMHARWLIYPDVSAVSVSDERLLDGVFGLVPQFESTELWGRERTYHMLSYWVWRHPYSGALRQQLESLLVQRPGDEQWPFLLAEMYHRLGQNSSAMIYYEQAMELDPNVNRANSRLNRLLRETELSRSARFFAEDLELETYAKLLGVSRDEIEVGDNVIRADHLQTRDSHLPDGWTPAIASGTHDWQFTVGRDNLEMPGSIRLVDLWWPMKDTESEYVPYVEYFATTEKINTLWVASSFQYKLDGHSDDVGLIFSHTGVTNTVKTNVHMFLPETSGEWKTVVIISQNQGIGAESTVSLRNWGGADIWFNNIRVQPLTLLTESKRCVEAQCAEILSEEGW